MNKQAMINALRAFVNQRSGIEFADYQSGDWKASREAFMGDYRPILRAGREARALLRAVELRGSITAEDLAGAARRAYAGRLSFVERGESVGVDYATVQYFPTEYRNAACAVLAQCLWEFWRECCPVGEVKPDKATPSLGNVGEYVRKQARNEFGRGIASRWFN